MRIGIFDSGIGGLTVAKEIVKELPWADIVYVGDTARVPYGPRSKSTIIQYSKEIIGYLLKQKVDIIAVACNTVSSVAIPEIKKMTKLPVVDMIAPAAEEAAKITKNNKIAVIGTIATINSNSYKKSIAKINPNIKVYQQACPLFVPFVEEGLGGDSLAIPIIKHYLNNKTINGSDTLILGCTHYPLMAQIQKFLGKKVRTVSCGAPAARQIKKIAEKFSKTNKKPKWDFLATDDPEKFSAQAKKFFGKDINIRLLALEKL